MKFAKRKSSGKRWTPEKIRKFCDMWPDYSAREIKRVFKDRSWRALRHMATKLKLGPRFRGFMSVRAAAQKIGYDIQWILKLIRNGEIKSHRLGVGQRFKREMLDFEELEAYVKRYVRLDTWESGGARNGLTGSSVRRIYARLGKLDPAKHRGWSRRLDPREVDETVRIWKSLTAAQKTALAAMKKAHPTKDIAFLVGSIVSQASSPMEPGNERSLSCSDSASIIGQAA